MGWRRDGAMAAARVAVVGWALGCGAVACLGCGARAELAESGGIARGDDARPVSGSARDGQTSDPGAGDPGADVVDPPRTGGFDFDSAELPDCEPGFRRSRARGRACEYLVEDRCYEDWVSACACACPSRGSSECIVGGFLSPPGEPLTVNCS